MLQTIYKREEDNRSLSRGPTQTLDFRGSNGYI